MLVPGAVFRYRGALSFCAFGGFPGHTTKTRVTAPDIDKPGHLHACLFAPPVSRICSCKPLSPVVYYLAYISGYWRYTVARQVQSSFIGGSLLLLAGLYKSDKVAARR